jgi:hypothetical protein
MTSRRPKIIAFPDIGRIPDDPLRAIEPFITIERCAELLGRTYPQMLRFINEAEVPTYGISKRRKLVRLSEVVAAIEATRKTGGAR